MKQIPLLQGKVLLIELPKQDFIKAKMQTLVDMRIVWSGKMNFKSGDGWESMSLPPGNWRIIGPLSELTESDAANIVDKTNKGEGLICFYDYKKQRYSHSLFTSIESLDSAIIAEGFSFENTEYVKPDHSLNADYDRWLEAESRVLCRERCLLLGREG